MRAPRAQLTASACNFVDWDNGVVGAAAIDIDAGKAIVNGCTFLEGEVHVSVGPDVRSAILSGNQATEGFRVDNQAGARTQAFGNEPFESIAWPEGAEDWYTLDIGAPGDKQYLSRWRRREGGMRWSTRSDTMRWTHSGTLRLPVRPGVSYDLTMEVLMERFAHAVDSGVYVDGQLIADLPIDGTATLRGTVPASSTGEVVIELRAEPWQPMEVVNLPDHRVLGVQGAWLELRAQAPTGATRPFSANTGRYADAQ